MTIRPPSGETLRQTALFDEQIDRAVGFESREEMIAHAIRMMRWRGEGRFDDLAKNMTEDCEMYFPGVPGQNPFNGTFRGRAACIGAMRENFVMIEFVDLRARSALAEGDTVIVNWACRMRNRGTGPMMPVDGMARVRFRDRLMYYYSNHLDTAVVGALAEFPPLKL